MKVPCALCFFAMFFAALAIVVGCVTPAVQPLDLQYHGQSLVEITRRHDLMLATIDRLRVNGQLAQVAPEFARIDALLVKAWQRESYLLRLAAIESGVAGDAGPNPDAR